MLWCLFVLEPAQNSLRRRAGGEGAAPAVREGEEEDARLHLQEGGDESSRSHRPTLTSTPSLP